uniref:Uncharacterized protein n=1 Tax=Arundo donax TaxID=35708 RepID=A0A0A9ASE1_ARUDO
MPPNPKKGLQISIHSTAQQNPGCHPHIIHDTALAHKRSTLTSKNNTSCNVEPGKSSSQTRTVKNQNRATPAKNPVKNHKFPRSKPRKPEGES